MKKMTTEDFIKLSKEKHGDKYDYSKVDYKNARTKVEIICPEHGSFFQYPFIHYSRGSGCPKCGIKINAEKRKLPTEELIKQFREVHGDKYDYSKIKYINIDTPIEIICPIHGSFWQSPYEHKNGANCPKCFGREKTTEDFIEKAREVHGDKYDYSESKYVNAWTKIKIICPEHGAFEQTYINHVNLKQNCPVCSKKTYKGEEKIALFLKDRNIEFETQKKFNDLKDKLKLSYDFYVPSKNLLIEYDGIQHFEPTGFGGDADENFEKTKKHDLLKEEYAKKNNYKLLRISYKDFDNIEEIIQKNISSTFINTWPAGFDKEKYAKEILNTLGDFPYDEYTDKELDSDFKNIKTSPASLTGMKIVKQFHKNIYSSRVGNKKSPVEVWEDKDILYRTILNRMKYRKPPYTPKVIRDGLNITKRAPKVSVFKPSLAAYLVDKYLSEFDTIFDPFSGFSGRLLGTTSLNKKYIGQDISDDMVSSSNEIIKRFNLNATVCKKDILESSGEYDCLFTCSPYNLKETWGDNIENKSCDEWIDVCLKNFKCKKYLFVVDKTEKYKNFVVEKIVNKSHFGQNTEEVILIESTDN